MERDVSFFFFFNLFTFLRANIMFKNQLFGWWWWSRSRRIKKVVVLVLVVE